MSVRHAVLFRFGFCFRSVQQFLRNMAGSSSQWPPPSLSQCVPFFPCLYTFCFSIVSTKLLILFSLALFCSLSLFSAFEIFVFLQSFIFLTKITFYLSLLSSSLVVHLSMFSHGFSLLFHSVIPSCILWTIILKQYLAFPILLRFF